MPAIESGEYPDIKDMVPDPVYDLRISRQDRCPKLAPIKAFGEDIT